LLYFLYKQASSSFLPCISLIGIKKEIDQGRGFPFAFIALTCSFPNLRISDNDSFAFQGV
ncbi:MAG: hypothetical protein II555_01220, partial [Bacteroidales bacterium]|nr:hypothetical protein [Bacteroidales bacterium]